MKPYYNIDKAMMPIFSQLVGTAWLSNQWVPTRWGCGTGMFWNWISIQSRLTF